VKMHVKKCTLANVQNLPHNVQFINRDDFLFIYFFSHACTTYVMS